VGSYSSICQEHEVDSQETLPRLKIDQKVLADVDGYTDE
jgi:hypothetical protein